MIFSENKNSFTLKTSPLTSTEQIKSGLWLTLIGVNEIPPHIALINDGEYYSQSAKKVDCGTPLDKFINVIQRKQISTIFIHIVTNNVIARNEAISANLLLEKIYKNLLPLSNVTNTCLSPIKAFFAEYYATEFSNTNYVFELLALAETKGLLKKSVSLFCEDSNSNIVTLPKYTMVQIQEKIQSLAIPVMSVK